MKMSPSIIVRSPLLIVPNVWANVTTFMRIILLGEYEGLCKILKSAGGCLFVIIPDRCAVAQSLLCRPSFLTGFRSHVWHLEKKNQNRFPSQISLKPIALGGRKKKKQWRQISQQNPPPPPCRPKYTLLRGAIPQITLPPLTLPPPGDFGPPGVGSF